MKEQENLFLVHRKSSTLKCLNHVVQFHDSPIHVKDLEVA